jgi:hypothetical protein
VTEAGSGAGRRRLVRGVVAIVLAAGAGVVAWWLVGRGVHTDDFPAFLETQSVTPITRYSGPWLTAAAGAALAAALLVMAAVFDLVRWSRAGAVPFSAESTTELTAPGSAGMNSSTLSSAQ